MKRIIAWSHPLLLGALLVAAQSSPARAERLPAGTDGDDNAIRVACIGDSITAGVGAGSGWDYPAQLGRMLGAKWTVRNFGVSGSTMLVAGNLPYQKQRAFKTALRFRPNVVLIMLGTNDTKPQNWLHKEDFYADCKKIVEYFEALDSKPKIYLCHPCPVSGEGNYGINEAGVEEEMPIIDRLAKEKRAAVVNVHDALASHPEYFPDRVHPNRAGATAIATTAYRALTGRKFEGAVPSPAQPAPNSP